MNDISDVTMEYNGSIYIPIFYQSKVNTLAVSDYKGAGNEYVQDNKLIVYVEQRDN